MLGLIVVAIMMGFPTAFTLMGLGMIFGYIAFWDPSLPWYDNRVFDLMVQRTFGGMNNDTLLSIPLFVFMGYVIERAALVDKMFYSVQLAFRRVPASLAVTTLLVCAFWGIASGIVGAVVVLMGVIALRPMLNAGYDVRLASGAITAGGTLGILIPPSVMLIVYAAVAGQSIVKLYAAAMFPGFFLTLLYLIYIVGWALIDPKIAPKLPEDQYRLPVPDWLKRLERGKKGSVFLTLWASAFNFGLAREGKTTDGKPVGYGTVLENAAASLIPIAFALSLFATAWWYVVIHNAPEAAPAAPMVAEQVEAPAPVQNQATRQLGADAEEEESEAEAETDAASEQKFGALGGIEAQVDDSIGHIPDNFFEWFWGLAATYAFLLLLYYRQMDGEQLEILKLLSASVMPLGILTFVVLAVILFGITTATESAAVGALGALYLASFTKYKKSALISSAIGLVAGLGFGLIRGDIATYVVSGSLGAVFVGSAWPWLQDFLSKRELKQTLTESTYLTAKTTAMVCWLFVGSALFSAVFALHGGQGLIERWVLGMDLSPIMFLIVAQAIIFILGWPLEWTEIIVIFVPIFIPLLAHYNVDPILFATMVAVNLQAAFLSPPVAMSAFYLKGVAPKHVTLNQIFAGMMPYMIIVILCLVIMYLWPGMTLWLPRFLYGG
ncbi:MAG: TRAP transporter large permease subunit [Alphaproteobacteria bacterium]|nr:TRAP transporter large permease subunit [Alphaproteobacteria bacterium]